MVNIGGETDRVFVPFIPRVEARPIKETLTYPKPPNDPLRLATDKKGSNREMRRCEPAPSEYEIQPREARVSIEVKAGPLDDTTFAVIDEKKSNENQICWHAFLRPLKAKAGGDLKFRVIYPVVSWRFRILE